MAMSPVLQDYIGDGVYAIYDGYGIWLHANDLIAPTDKVYLEPHVIKGLSNFVERIDAYQKEQAKHA